MGQKHSKSFKYNLLIIGHSNVGQRALINNFDRVKQVNNIEYKVKHKVRRFETVELNIRIVDISEANENNFYNIDGAILMFDNTNRDSYEQLKLWTQHHCEPNSFNKLIKIMASNRNGGRISRVVDNNIADKYAKSLNMSLIEICTTNGKDVNFLLDSLCIQLLNVTPIRRDDGWTTILYERVFQCKSLTALFIMIILGVPLIALILNGTIKLSLFETKEAEKEEILVSIGRVMNVSNASNVIYYVK